MSTPGPGNSEQWISGKRLNSGSAVTSLFPQALAELFDKLKAENNLRNGGPLEFGARAGYYLTELNAIHPFREGNGRAQREFIRELGLHARLSVDWTRATRDEMYSASVAGFRGDSHPMGDLISRITTALLA
jgi:fido (protein-threonine AMPylation protein)